MPVSNATTTAVHRAPASGLGHRPTVEFCNDSNHRMTLVDRIDGYPTPTVGRPTACSRGDFGRTPHSTNSTVARSVLILLLLLGSTRVGAQGSVCGNGLVEAGEVCDDGSALNGGPNRCATDCLGTTPSICGNRVIEEGELCDDGGDALGCDADCTPALCGDGTLNAHALEACDDGPDNGQPTSACDASCQPVRPDGEMHGGSCALTRPGRPRTAWLLFLPVAIFGLLRRLRHRHIAKRPFPEAWRAILAENIPYVRCLDDASRRRLETLIQIFVAEKRFVGAHGLEVTDEMRISVAAQACMLLIGDPETEVYPDLGSVVLYPEAYVARRTSTEGMVVNERNEARLGESWDRGTVVLAWNAVAHGARDMRDGHNVVYHEFAHQLDQDFGDADGAPALPEGMSYGHWARALGKEFAKLERATERGRPSLLDGYGATSPAEFFAVATEAFFEKPVQMRRRKPELYAQLAAFYRQDPAERITAKTS